MTTTMRRRLRYPRFESLNVFAAICAVLFLLLATAAQAERVKDLASVQGVRTNQLMGYGLVVGLDGTGDQTSQTPFTLQSIKNMLIRYGVTIPPGTNPQLKNVAAVTVHADLPPFSKPGQNIDVTVSSIGNAGSLRGGSLIMTPLTRRRWPGVRHGAGQPGGRRLRRLGQGRLAHRGQRAFGGPRAQWRHRGARGAHRASHPTPFVMLNLHTPDFTTRRAWSKASTSCWATPPRRPWTACRCKVAAPADANQRIAYLSTLEQIEIEPGDAPARVIVNSRTGTVVIGSHVRVMPAAVAHGSLSVTITERASVSQPYEFSRRAKPWWCPRARSPSISPTARMFVFDAGVDLNDIVRAVNQVGAAPGDLVAILEALKESGALRAELIVI